MAETVLLAPDAFKGTMSARSVVAALAAGLRARGVRALECPIADGGEGTIDVLLPALGGRIHRAPCSDALGRPVEARWAMLADGRTALVEVAEASGLALITPHERDAERASTAGTGELVIAAIRAGASRVVLAIGGTATTDGGVGALGVIEAAGGPGEAELLLACDVMVPFELAAEVYAPQKGASAETVARLTARLQRIARELPRDPRGREMTGAGGGLAGALWARYGAELVSGSAYVLDALGFDRRLGGVDAVVTGEGRLDGTSLEGKAVGEVLGRARRRGVAVDAVAGAADIGGAGGDWHGLRALRIAGSIEELEDAGRSWPWPAGAQR